VPCQLYSGTCGSITVHVVHNGVSPDHSVCRVGTNGATLAGFVAITALKPDLVISGGTAGGFKARGADIESIFVSSACMNHDRRIPLPGYDKWGIDYIHSHPTPALAEALGALHRRLCALVPFDVYCVVGERSTRVPSGPS
jgi:5'-methylthioadenosine nucleosidase